jgi:hypothetical protein
MTKDQVFEGNSNDMNINSWNFSFEKVKLKSFVINTHIDFYLPYK